MNGRATAGDSVCPCHVATELNKRVPSQAKHAVGPSISVPPSEHGTVANTSQRRSTADEKQFRSTSPSPVALPLHEFVGSRDLPAVQIIGNLFQS
ncbi:hypothetical protein BaRGS_00010793 [Batillaria attramentaria]|uniref:Uncharacterized protein n=1 Tax=Batillaria attramentaria TaxID=370345 RepID=A0ABD0LFT3_9CAEN